MKNTFRFAFAHVIPKANFWHRGSSPLVIYYFIFLYKLLISEVTFEIVLQSKVRLGINLKELK